MFITQYVTINNDCNEIYNTQIFVQNEISRTKICDYIIHVTKYVTNKNIIY